jgi:tetratricopeptide (TPR) repeat protein
MQPHLHEHGLPREQSTPEGNCEESSFFVTAAILARRGQYEAAAKYLRQALDAGQCSEVQYLDLQARICAQMGLYLDAATCWRKARTIDPSNPAYASGLARLAQLQRQTLNPFHIVIGVFGLIAVLLLAWQALIVQPRSATRIASLEQAMSDLHANVAAWSDQGHSSDNELAGHVGSLQQQISGLDDKFSQRFGALPSTQQAEESKSAIIAQLDKRTSDLEKSLTQLISDLQNQRAESDASQTKRLESLSSGLAAIKDAFSSNADVTAKQMDSLYSKVNQQLKSAASSDQVAALGNSLSQLQSQVVDLTEKLNGLKAEQQKPAADAKSISSTTRP